MPTQLDQHLNTSRFKQKEKARILLDTYSSFYNSNNHRINKEMYFLDRELRILLEWKKIANEGAQLEAVVKDIDTIFLRASVLTSLLNKNKSIS